MNLNILSIHQKSFLKLFHAYLKKVQCITYTDPLNYNVYCFNLHRDFINIITIIISQHQSIKTPKSCFMRVFLSFHSISQYKDFLKKESLDRLLLIISMHYVMITYIIGIKIKAIAQNVNLF